MAGAVKTKSAALIGILVVFLILIIINLISLNLFARWDITENKIYSVSETSRKIIRGLDDRLTVKAFFSSDLPAPHNSDKRYLNDILDDFKAYSNGKLNYEFIDPLQEKNQKEAASYRLQPGRFSLLGSTKAETILGYKGVVLLYGGRQEVMPFIMNMSNFEYDFVRLVKKLTSSKLPRIAFTTGHGESDLGKNLTAAQQMLQEDFEVVPLTLSGIPSIPTDIKAIFVVTPLQPFTDWETYLLDQFIMHGGKVAFFINSFNLNQANQSIDPVSTGLDPLLNHYGVGVNKDFVIDKNCLRYMNYRKVQGGFVPENIEVPFFINILNFNPDNITVKLQKSMSIVGASSLDTTLVLPTGLKREVLFTSSAKSGSITGDIAAGLQTLDDKKYNKSMLPLAVVVSGTFPSLYANRAMPEFMPTDTAQAVSIPAKVDQGVESRILVVGNGSFFDDNAANDRQGRFNADFIFFRNAVDWLAQDEDLISIRSKGNIYSPFTKLLSESSETTIKILNVFTIPVLVIIFGVIRWQVKRSSKRKGIF